MWHVVCHTKLHLAIIWSKSQDLFNVLHRHFEHLQLLKGLGAHVKDVDAGLWLPTKLDQCHSFTAGLYCLHQMAKHVECEGC